VWGLAVTKYLFACKQIDTSWIELEFASENDELAVTYALEMRTSAECRLYKSDQLLATFDGLVGSDASHQDRRSTQAEEGLGLETESAYFVRKATELRMRALDAPLRRDVKATFALAEDLDSLGRALVDYRRRQMLHHAEQRAAP
jgi:hypothetical protein